MVNLCEKYDASMLQQLYKIVTDEDNGGLKNKDVFPVTVLQAVFDGITGIRLDHLLSLNNYVWLPFKGTKEATRIQVVDDMRRTGLVVSFKDYNNTVYSQKYAGASYSDSEWQDDSNWDNVFTSFEDTEIVNTLKEYLKEYVDRITVRFSVVKELPEVLESNVIYLVKNSGSDGNMYDEYIGIDGNPELIGQADFEINIDDSLSDTSENPVQNKVITEVLNRLLGEVFPLSISVSGGGLYEKRTSQTVTVRWAVKEGNDTVTPDTVTVNDESVSPSSSSKVFENVTVNTTYTVKAVKNGVTVQGSVSAAFVNPSYFGVVDAGFSPTEEAIKALTKTIKNTKNYTGNASLVHQKVCYAYPKSFGALTSIKDANNFEYLSSYTRGELQVWDETYYVYVLTDPVTIDTFRQIYS